MKWVSGLSASWNHLVSFSSIPVPGPHHRGSDLIGLGVNLAFGISIKCSRDSAMQPGLRTALVWTLAYLLHVGPPSLLPVFFPTSLLKTESHSQLIDLSFIYHLHCLQINLSKPVLNSLLSWRNCPWLPLALHESKKTLYLSPKAFLGVAPIFPAMSPS